MFIIQKRRAEVSWATTSSRHDASCSFSQKQRLIVCRVAHVEANMIVLKKMKGHVCLELWVLSVFLSSAVGPSRLLRDEEDGRGDKEPVPPPSRLPFVALSPLLLVTHDYALSTADQVLLFACNSMAISVNLCRAQMLFTLCVFSDTFYMWLAYSGSAPSPRFLEALQLYC